MEDGHGLDKVRPHTVHGTVVAVNYLSDSVVANLRDDVSGQRRGLEAFHCGYEAFNKEVGVSLRVTCHVGPYRFEVFDGLR